MDQHRDDQGVDGGLRRVRSAESRPAPVHTVLRELLRQRHMLPYRLFRREYDKVAATTDKRLVGTGPAEGTYKRWLGGKISGLPRSEPCVVLEAMFPGYSVEKLFSLASPADGSNPGAIAPVAPIYLLPRLQEPTKDSQSIAVIRAMSESLQMADRKLGGGLLYQTVSQYLRAEIAPYLLDPPEDCSPIELFSAAASLTEIAGWMAHDGGHNAKARGHFAQAYRLATTGENPALSANVCASMAHLAIQLELPDDADRIATAGLCHIAEIDGGKHLVARLHAMWARAHAMRGQERACRMALDAAHDSLETQTATTSIEWIANFDEASLASEAALCFFALGSLLQAERESRKVIHLRAGDRVRSRALGQLTLANVLVREGNYDEAAHVGLEICNVAPALNSARVHSGLLGLRETLFPHGANPEVAAFIAAQGEMRQAPTTSRQDARWPV